MKTKIIAFSGRKQSGKSTAGNYIESLISNYNQTLSYNIYSFADPLKQAICIDILGLTYEQCYGSDDDKNTITDLEWGGKRLTAREAMEIIGTDIFRKIKNNVWVDATINKIKKDNLDIAIIADCRFPNEVEAIKVNGGLIVRLDLDPFGSSSPSESALDKDNYDWNNFDIIIHNKDMNVHQKNTEIFNFLLSKGLLQL